MIPWPIWSTVIEATGPIACGVRTMVEAPSHVSATIRLIACRRSSGDSGSVMGARSDWILPATREAASQASVAIRITLTSPIVSATLPPRNTPTSSASVPPTVAIEFAISRSSAGTSRGTTAEAAASWNRLIDRTASAPAKNRILVGQCRGSNRISGTNAIFSSGAIVRILRRDHRSMNTPTKGPSRVNGRIVTRLA